MGKSASSCDVVFYKLQTGAYLHKLAFYKVIMPVRIPDVMQCYFALSRAYEVQLKLDYTALRVNRMRITQVASALTFISGNAEP